jgi:hypothetical protein
MDDTSILELWQVGMLELIVFEIRGEGQTKRRYDPGIYRMA